MINVIVHFLVLDLVNINVSAKFYQNIPNGLRVKFHCFKNLNLGKTSTNPQMSFDNLIGYIMSISMCMHNFIIILHSVQEIGPFSLFQNLDLSQISFDNLIGYVLSISMCMQNFITIFFTVLQIGPFSLFQNLELGKAWTDKNVILSSLGLDLVNINV